MRVGPPELPEPLFLLFVYLLPALLIVWFIISTLAFRREMRGRRG